MLDARDRLHSFDHALLHGGYSVNAVTRHGQVRTDQHRVPRLETEVAMQRTHKSAHRDQGRRYQYRTDRNLQHKQHLADGYPPPKSAPARSGFDDLVRIG